MRTGLLVLWAALAAILLFVAGVFGTLAITNRLGGDVGVASPAPNTPAVSETTDTTYTVLILNATGDASRATAVHDQVQAAGWPSDKIDAADAAESDFPTTTVYYVEDGDEPAARGLADAIGATSVVQDDTYARPDAEGRSPLAIVIGLDAATPAP